MARAIRVGVLNDMADGPPAPGDMTHWLRREVDLVRAAGRLAPDVEFVHAYGLGLPQGTAAAVERAYRELVEQDVMMIVGPMIGDNALIATPLAETARVPTINWAGAERGRGEFMFHLQVGSHEDESLVIARHMKAIGADRLGVVFDQSPIGTRHLEYLKDEARIIGQDIVAAEAISPLETEAGEPVRRVLAHDPQGFVYLGLGRSSPAVAEPLAASGWQGPRIMNTSGMFGYLPEYGKALDGWIYVDMFSDSNRTLQQLLQQGGIPEEGASTAARGHDLGRLVAEGLARSREFTRDGIRTGLEQVKWLPAAEGEEGTLLGFGIQDRGALHGRYLVLRQWRKGDTVEVRAPS